MYVYTHTLLTLYVMQHECYVFNANEFMQFNSNNMVYYKSPRTKGRYIHNFKLLPWKLNLLNVHSEMDTMLGDTQCDILGKVMSSCTVCR